MKAKNASQRYKNFKRQLDSHCWKYYLIKFNTDYILQSRQRVHLQIIHWAGKK